VFHPDERRRRPTATRKLDRKRRFELGCPSLPGSSEDRSSGGSKESARSYISSEGLLSRFRPAGSSRTGRAYDRSSPALESPVDGSALRAHTARPTGGANRNHSWPAALVVSNAWTQFVTSRDRRPNFTITITSPSAQYCVAAFKDVRAAHTLEPRYVRASPSDQSARVAIGRQGMNRQDEKLHGDGLSAVGASFRREGAIGEILGVYRQVVTEESHRWRV
jgi:hypothetical protein